MKRWEILSKPAAAGLLFFCNNQRHLPDSRLWKQYCIPTRSVGRYWMRAQRKRSQKINITWKKFARLGKMYIPSPKRTHNYPYKRFDTKYAQQEPDAGILHVRICTGGIRWLLFLLRPQYLVVPGLQIICKHDLSYKKTRVFVMQLTLIILYKNIWEVINARYNGWRSYF